MTEWIRSATSSRVRSSTRSGHRIVNSSPPNRATESVAQRTAEPVADGGEHLVARCAWP